MSRFAFDAGHIVSRAFTLSLCTLAGPAGAQERVGVMGDLLNDVGIIEEKIVGLAKTMPPTVYDWRPAKGVRSTGEVLVHMAGDNYFLPALLGVTPPPEPASMVETTKRLQRSRHAP